MENILINNRVCPLPMVWNDFYEHLKRENKEIKINPPLILGAWNFTNDSEKLARFKEHLSFVNTGSDSYNFLLSLTDEKWHHDND
jgi:hypothetical protein